MLALVVAAAAAAIAMTALQGISHILQTQ